jgi:aldose sugar dehydrogenase
MHRNSLLAATFLSAALIASPALAQDEGTSPEEEVAEGSVAPDEGEEAAARQPVETAEPNAPDQEPAFAEQTRAPQPEAMPATTYEVIAEELPHLWSLAFLPDGGMLVTAKNGAFHYVSAEGEVGEAITEGVPEVDERDQGGLLDVVLAPDFEESNRIFFSFAEPREEGNGTSVAAATLVLDDNGGGVLEDVEVIFQQEPSYDGTMHFGSRLVFSPEGDLYVTVGERSDAEVRDQAQDLSSGLGKVFRIDVNGEAPSDNPFVDQEDALPQIWSYGHRNMQSAALDGQGRLLTVEHGPRGGDELNRPEPGLNYGWPNVTYGLEYDGDTVGQGVTQSEDTEQPVYYWDPSFAPSGMAYYEGEEFPEWQGAFLIGGLVSTGLVIVHIEDDLVAYEERVPLERRVRDVRVAPDGSVYVVTEDREAGTSEILRITRDS